MTKEERRVYYKAWREANPEKSEKASKDWRDANSEKCRAYGKAYRSKFKDLA